MNAENPVQIDLFGVSTTRTKDTRLAEHIGGSRVSAEDREEPYPLGHHRPQCGVARRGRGHGAARAREITSAAASGLVLSGPGLRLGRGRGRMAKMSMATHVVHAQIEAFRARDR
jgi:hypothetical protein